MRRPAGATAAPQHDQWSTRVHVPPVLRPIDREDHIAIVAGGQDLTRLVPKGPSTINLRPVVRNRFLGFVHVPLVRDDHEFWGAAQVVEDAIADAGLATVVRSDEDSYPRQYCTQTGVVVEQRFPPGALHVARKGVDLFSLSKVTVGDRALA